MEVLVTSGLSIRKVPTTEVEPVDLAMLKKHLQIDFDDHDQLLEFLLESAREEVEQYTGLSLIESTVTVRWETLTTGVLPFGPVKEITSDISAYTKKGLDYPSITANSYEPVEITYTAGFETVPSALQLAIIKLATDNFTQRVGIELNSNAAAVLPNDWKSVARKYSKRSWLD